MKTPREILENSWGIYTPQKENVDIALNELAEWVREHKDNLPLELQHCTMNIYHKQQNLTPLFNEIKNQALEDIAKELEGK